ncbi:glycosyltransferase family 4 protein [soil metagenome]
MRAAVVYDCLFPLTHGGGERVYRSLSELLVERGYELDYVTRQLPGVASAPFAVVPVWNGEIYDDHGARTPGGALKFAAGVYRHFRAHRRDYDIVVASALPVLTLLAARAALVGSPTVLVGDWLEVWTWRKWRSYSGAIAGTAAWMLQWVGARAASVHTVNSSFTARSLARVRRSVSPVVLGLVDLVPGTGNAAPVPAADPPYVLFVGRLIDDKRAHVIPAALEVARRSIPGLQAILVGDGPELARVRSEIAAHGLDNEIRILARVSDDELVSLMRSAAVLVNPSRREGFGLVVVEAAAAGTPSIVVRGVDNAAVDLIEPENGLVVDDIGAEAVAGAIVSIVNAGMPLRYSTAAWFERARTARGLSASVDRLLAAVSARSGAR